MLEGNGVAGPGWVRCGSGSVPRRLCNLPDEAGPTLCVRLV